MMYRRFAAAVALAVACSSAYAGSLANAYIDDARNVHVVTAAGKDLQLTSDRQAKKVRLSAEGESVAWLVAPPADAGDEEGPAELRIYSRGRTRSIKCEPVIRDFWFWKQGSHIAIDCGGTHFAGREILYNVRSLKKITSFDQAEVPVEQRPKWSASSEQFESD
ncbi:hypothetical protein [Pseudoduganella violaceinigra]|uniref:hypothetical protein n=1 Tax=Pseudoduganella violaceinigra TaxID=246602 RepID=UPI0003FBD3AA|nr:hypothetical protein [Pseudoduganella violaceinigra]